MLLPVLPTPCVPSHPSRGEKPLGSAAHTFRRVKPHRFSQGAEGDHGDYRNPAGTPHWLERNRSSVSSPRFWESCLMGILKSLTGHKSPLTGGSSEYRHMSHRTLHVKYLHEQLTSGKQGTCNQEDVSCRAWCCHFLCGPGQAASRL